VISRKIVLFDIDGTLLRGAGPHHKEALIEGARSVLDVHCTLDGVDTSGRLDRDLLALMLQNSGVPKHKIAANLLRIMEASQHHYTLHCQVDLAGRLCPGVKDTLQLLSESGIPMGLVTGNLSAIAWRKLQLAGIDRFFSFGGFAEQGTTRARLAKIAVWQAKKKKLVPRRCHVVLVGDHANDIGAAQANGFRSIAVATGVMHPEQLSRFNPDLILPTLEGATLDTIFGVE
jgi:phosphoglycolate phosphatase-like HAD superfamily hydrolase